MSSQSAGLPLQAVIAMLQLRLYFINILLSSVICPVGISRRCQSSCWSLVTRPFTSSAPAPAQIFIPDIISRSCRTSSRSYRICPSAGLRGPQSLSINLSSHETAEGIPLPTGVPRPLARCHAPPRNAPCAPSHLAQVSPDSLASNMMVHWSTVTNGKYRTQRGGPPAQ